MPTVEFHGFSAAAQAGLVQVLREEFVDLDFRDDIVFVLDDQPRYRVETWGGGEAPFVRIHSRSSERLSALVEKAVPHTDVETMNIGFYEQSTRS